MSTANTRHITYMRVHSGNPRRTYMLRTMIVICGVNMAHSYVFMPKNNNASVPNQLCSL